MGRTRYPIPQRIHRVEQQILRSRFIATLGHAPTLEDARTFIAAVGEEFADASHNCWAYNAGPPESTASIGMSDAGEPHGTAGRPMLTVLLHSGIGEIAAVVTRYFGGTKLGKGGLVRAYSGSVQLALEDLPVVEKVPTAAVTVMLDYRYVTPFSLMLPEHEASIVDEQYAVDVTYRLKMPVERVEQFTTAVADLTHGQAVLEVINEINE